MRFIIFVIDEPGNLGNDSEMADIDQFNESLQKDGNWVTAAGISASDKSTIIDNRAGKEIVIAGSLVTSKENYSGFWIIEAESHERAQALAKAGSKACNRKVELRPFLR
ncbi:MAG: YciI family protein [Actinomycetales bacterium]